MRIEIFRTHLPSEHIDVAVMEGETYFHLSCSPDTNEPEIASGLMDLAEKIKNGWGKYQQVEPPARELMADSLARVATNILVSQEPKKSPSDPKSN